MALVPDNATLLAARSQLSLQIRAVLLASSEIIGRLRLLPVLNRVIAPVRDDDLVIFPGASILDDTAMELLLLFETGQDEQVVDGLALHAQERGRLRVLGRSLVRKGVVVVPLLRYLLLRVFAN